MIRRKDLNKFKIDCYSGIQLVDFIWILAVCSEFLEYENWSEFRLKNIVEKGFFELILESLKEGYPQGVETYLRLCEIEI